MLCWVCGWRLYSAAMRQCSETGFSTLGASREVRNGLASPRNYHENRANWSRRCERKDRSRQQIIPAIHWGFARLAEIFMRLVGGWSECSALCELNVMWPPDGTVIASAVRCERAWAAGFAPWRMPHCIEPPVVGELSRF